MVSEYRLTKLDLVICALSHNRRSLMMGIIVMYDGILCLLLIFTIDPAKRRLNLYTTQSLTVQNLLSIWRGNNNRCAGFALLLIFKSTPVFSGYNELSQAGFNPHFEVVNEFRDLRHKYQRSTVELIKRPMTAIAIGTRIGKFTECQQGWKRTGRHCHGLHHDRTLKTA